LSFRLKITYTCLAILKVAVCTACCNIKLLCIVPHSRFIINLLSVKKNLSSIVPSIANSYSDFLPD
jgi:hypothetical protein